LRPVNHAHNQRLQAGGALQVLPFARESRGKGARHMLNISQENLPVEHDGSGGGSGVEEEEEDEEDNPNVNGPIALSTL